MLYRLTVHALTIAKPKWYKTCTKKTVAQALTIAKPKRYAPDMRNGRASADHTRQGLGSDMCI